MLTVVIDLCHNRRHVSKRANGWRGSCHLCGRCEHVIAGHETPKRALHSPLSSPVPQLMEGDVELPSISRSSM